MRHLSNNLSVWHKLLLLVLIPLVFEVIFVCSLAALLSYAEQQYDRYEQSRKAVISFHQAEHAMVQSIAPVVYSFTRDGDAASGYLDDAIVAARRSRDMIVDSTIRPELKEFVLPMRDVLDRMASAAEKMKVVLKDTSIEPVKRPKYARESFLPILFEFEPLAKRLLAAESEMKASAPAEMHSIRILVAMVLFTGIAISIMMSAAGLYLFSTSVLRRLRILEENAQLLAIRAPFKESAPGKDEIGELNYALERANIVLTETRRKELVILDVAADVICSLDKRYRFTAIGAGARPGWGYDPDDLLGDSFFSLLVQDSKEPSRLALEQIALSAADMEFESGLISKDGSVKDILWKVSWSKQNQSFYCVAHDISERRAAERMKQRFISIASHDLRTPLSSISATLSVLAAGKRGPLPERTQEVLHQTEASLERLMDLIRDLLDLEKLEAGKVVMELNCVSALDVCMAACDSVEFLARSLHIDIVKPYSDSALLADERSLVRVLINLLSNAIKFSPRGSTVTVTIKNLGTVTEIGVTDQGPGISAADQEIIFEKFRQSRIKTDTPVKGTGLGLAIAKLIAEARHGQIGIESQPGNGSRFYIQIPNFEDNEEPE